jgi:hypothetical protein
MYGSYCKTTAYRIEHKELKPIDIWPTDRRAIHYPFYMGPYELCNSLSTYKNTDEGKELLVEGKRIDIRGTGKIIDSGSALRLMSILRRNEDIDNPRLSPEKAADLYWNYSVKNNRPLPVFWNALRPGPREDFYLSDFMKCIPLGSFIATNCGFGYSSEEQMNRWLFDPDERRALRENGFIARKYEQIWAVIGHCQALLFHAPTTKSVSTNLL